MWKWNDITKKLPVPGRNYIICASYAGLVTYDVAFYNGKGLDGSLWFSFGDVSITSRNVTHWTEIVEPEGLRNE